MEEYPGIKAHDILSKLFYLNENGEFDILEWEYQIDNIAALAHKYFSMGIENYLINIPNENINLVLDRCEDIIKGYQHIAQGISNQCKDNDKNERCKYVMNILTCALFDLQEKRRMFKKQLIEYPSLMGQAKPQPAPTAKRGRPKKTLKECFKVDEAAQKQYMQRLHSIMKDAKGKKAALAIKLLVEHNKMEKPPFKALEIEFENIGNVSGYNNYYSKGLEQYTQEEKEGMKRELGL